MAQLFSSGFETGNLSEWSGSFGTAPTVQSSVKRQGTYATEKTNASTGWFWKTLSNQTVFIRFYLRLTGYPSVESSFYVGEVATSFADVGKLRIGTDGKIRLYNGASGSDVLIGSPSAAISLNTWHRIELKEVCDNTNGELVARLNDVEFAADTALNGLLSLQDTIVLADLIFKTAGVAPQDVFSLADNIAREVSLPFGELSTLIEVIQNVLDRVSFGTVGMSDEFSFVLTEGPGLPYFEGWAVLPRPRLKRRKWRKRPFGDNLDAQWRRARKIWARSLPS